MRTLNTSIRPLGKRCPTALMSARPRPRLRLRKHSEAPHFTCTPGWCCLTLFAATCSYPGCTHLAVMYPPDHYWNYCSESHERYVLMFDFPATHSKDRLVSRGKDVSIVAGPLGMANSSVKDAVKLSGRTPRPSSLCRWITMRSGMVRLISPPALA
jgi:hypothetical protein